MENWQINGWRNEMNWYEINGGKDAMMDGWMHDRGMKRRMHGHETPEYETFQMVGWRINGRTETQDH